MVPFYENKKQVNKFKLKRESSVEKNNDLKAEKNWLLKEVMRHDNVFLAPSFFFRSFSKGVGESRAEKGRPSHETASGILVPNVTQKQ